MQILNPREVRSLNETVVDLGDGVGVRCRKEDMTILVFEGRVPMPMLSAMQKMVDLPDATPEERVASLGADHGMALVQTLREHVCRVSLEPVIVMEADGNPDHLEVEFLSLQDLVKIWQETAVVPSMGATAAARFRRRPSPTLTAVPSTRADVSDAAQSLVDSPDELVSG